MGVATHLDAVVGKHMAVVLDVLAEFVALAVFQPGLEARQHVGERQLLGRIRPGVGQGNVGSFARLHAERDADDFGAHFVKRGGFGVDGHQLGRLQALHPLVEIGPVQDGVVHHAAVLRGLGHGAGGVVGEQVTTLAGHGDIGGVCGRRGGRLQRAGQAFEAVQLVKIFQSRCVGRANGNGL